MVAVNLNKRQVGTRKLTGWVLIGIVAMFWMLMFLFADDRPPSHSFSPPNGMKVLYIISSSNEYNTGDKETNKGQDRLMEITVPVMLEGVESMVPEYQVDVYLILGYQLSDERRQIIHGLLPIGVGLQVWNEATPLNCEFISRSHRQVFVSETPRALARQHRYVVKDKLPYYDFFLAFEDDMLLTKTHIDYYLEFRNEIRQLKEYAPSVGGSRFDSTQKWWGNLTRDQLDHIMPGFLRVEVLNDPQHRRQPQSKLDPIPVYRRARPDPRICCHSKYVGLQGKLAPQFPTSDQLVIWETAIPGLFVRQMPPNRDLLDWVALLPIKGSPMKIHGYWSGTDGALMPVHPKKPSTILNEFIGQSAGWMASANEILELDEKLCKLSFLPPFDRPQMKEDGMGFETDAVEFWSGGLQLWGQMCEIQRVVSLDPKQFSKHLLYHTANNKQKEIPRERLVKVPTLLGQLHTVKQRAQIAMNHELGKDSLISRFLRAVGLAS
jgi:hypothetical protein